MTPAIFEMVLENLHRGPKPLTDIYALAKEYGSAWTEAQLHLMLVCMDGIEIVKNDNGLLVKRGQRTPEEELTAAIIDVVKAQAGRPIPAAAIKRQLPGHFITSEEQIKALARKSPQLKIVGPGLITTPQ